MRPPHDLILPLTRRSFLGMAAMMFAARALPVSGEDRKVAEDSVFELRQYTLYGRQRDTLISLFEKNFIESQEAVGAHVVGTFRDLDDPDRFVWIRGFQDMPKRQHALGTFYGGMAWAAHKEEANATMLDSDNVLLLRALSPLEFHGSATNAAVSNAVYGITIYYLGTVDARQFAEFFESIVLPQLNATGVHLIATLTTDDVPNNFPRLPVREHDRVFLWMGRWTSESDYESFYTGFKAWSGWRDTAPQAVLPALMRKPERLRLKPTLRSPLQ